jgi:arginine deiminase
MRTPARQQETEFGKLVIIDTNQGDFGFYRKIYRRVVLIENGTDYYMINGKNVLSIFETFEYNHHASDGPNSRFGAVERQANEAFESALTALEKQSA